MADEHRAKKQKMERNPASFLPAITSFEKAMKDKTFFADKSALIPYIESIENAIFCRPRRFGKSLILQMLMAYFDKRTDDEKFKQLFGSLWIGGSEEGIPHKTELQGKFIILPLDFSRFKLDARNPDKLIDDFEGYIVDAVLLCAKKYSLSLLRQPTTPPEALTFLQAAAEDHGSQVYVFIDEYDTPFSQVVMDQDLTVEQKETTLRRLSKSYNPVILTIKSLRFRLFMTGILDITIPALSGNTFSRTTFEPGWHTLSGFTEDDVKVLLQKVSDLLLEDDPRRYLLSPERATDEADDPRKALKDQRTALERLRAAYNGYWFAGRDRGQPRMYNADMVLYFVRFILGESSFPEKGELIDPNASISNKILKFAGSLSWLGGLLVAPLSERFTTFHSPAVTINMDEIMVLFRNPLDPEARNIFWRLLYYYGALTTNRIARTLGGGDLIFSICVPNAVAKDEYLGTIWKHFDQKDATSLASARQHFNTFIKESNPIPFLDSLAKGDFQITRWDFGGSDVFDPEASFKAILLMCINLVRGQDVTLNNEDSYNPDQHSPYGYFSDITLLPTDPSKPGIILELKNVTVAALYPGKENWTTKIAKAKRELPAKPEKDLLKMPLYDADGNKTNKTVQNVLNEALAQVEGYRQKAVAEKKRESGYKAWAIIRVGLFRFLAFEKK